MSLCIYNKMDQGRSVATVPTILQRDNLLSLATWWSDVIPFGRVIPTRKDTSWSQTEPVALTLPPLAGRLIFQRPASNLDNRLQFVKKQRKHANYECFLMDNLGLEPFVGITQSPLLHLEFFSYKSTNSLGCSKCFLCKFYKIFVNREA